MSVQKLLVPLQPQISKVVTGCYQPSPVRRVEIAKPDGGTRQLGTDRVIQQTIAQVLTAIFDPDFSEHSFSIPSPSIL